MSRTFGKVNGLVKEIRDIFRCQICLKIKDENSIIFYWSCNHIFCLDCVGEGNPCTLCTTGGSNWNNKQVKIVQNDSILAVFRLSMEYEYIADKLNLCNPEENTNKELEGKCSNIILKDKSFDINISADNSTTEVTNPNLQESSYVKEVNCGSDVGENNVKRSGKEKLKSFPHKQHLKEKKIRNSNVSSSRNIKRKENVEHVKGNKINSGAERERSNVKRQGYSGVNSTYEEEKIGSIKKTPKKSCPKECDVEISKGLEKSLLNSGSKKIKNVGKRNHKGETPLHLACRKGNISHMQELVDAGANPNVQDNAGWTPLHDSVVFEQMEAVKFLLNIGARVNTPGHENVTALHQAVIQGNTEIARLLLRHGAEKNARNIFGETPLDLMKQFNITIMEEVMMNTPAKCKSKSNVLDESFTQQSKDDIVLCRINLNENETSTFEEFTRQFNYKTVDKLLPQLSATHVILSEDEVDKISWSIVPAVLMACRVVSVTWMKDSVRENAVQPMEKYELTSDFYSGFSKSRTNQLNQFPGLFSGCHFYFGGNFELYKTKHSSFLKIELKSLVEKNGGVILSRNPDPESLALEKTIPYHADVNGPLAKTSYYIIYSQESWDPTPKYNMAHMKTLPVEWLLASIFKFELLNPSTVQSYVKHI